MLVANENPIDPKSFQDPHQKYYNLEWELKAFNAWQNPEPYLEIQLKNDNLLMHPHTRSYGTGSIKVAIKTDPSYTHVVASCNRQAPRQSSMMALITGQAPPSFIQPRCKQQAAPPTGLLSGLPSSSASPARAGCEVSEPVDKSRRTDQQQPPKIYKLPPTPSRKRIWDKLPVVQLVTRLLLPWIITAGDIHTASGTCGMSRKSLVKSFLQPRAHECGDANRCVGPAGCKLSR